MEQNEKGWLASRFARLSTGLKMLLILSLGLFPLGLIAVVASIESARANSAQRAEQTLAQLDLKAQRINNLLSRSAGTIRAASAAIALTPPGSAICETTLMRLERAQYSIGRFALYGNDNSLRCATPGYAPPSFPAPAGARSLIEISPDGETLRFALFDDRGRLEGTGEFSRESLADLTFLPGTRGDFDLELLQGERRMRLRDGFDPGLVSQTVSGVAAIAGSRLLMRIELSAVPVSVIQGLMILLPVMMWMGAAIIGWIILDRLLLRPLVRMERAIAAYRPGDRHLDLPNLSTPAHEIAALGRAFDRATQTVARHEADLETALESQKRLVREVHHRVKNNLQVVASLLNLHARGADNEEVANAYASIQRRVDALAVVHRNHYAELEENRGVPLRSLVSELAANLRATAPPSAADMAIRIDIDPCHVTQDVAVSVAFLITEIVEYAMFCGATTVNISLQSTGTGTALLAIASDSLRGESGCEPALTERFERIVTGLARQLRSTLERDPSSGRYALEIAALDESVRRSGG